MAQQKNSASEGTLKTPQPKAQIQTSKKIQLFNKKSELIIKTDNGAEIPSQDFVDEAFMFLELDVECWVGISGCSQDEKYIITLCKNVKKTGYDGDYISMPIETEDGDIGENLNMYGWQEI